MSTHSQTAKAIKSFQFQGKLFASAEDVVTWVIQEFLEKHGDQAAKALILKRDDLRSLLEQLDPRAPGSILEEFSVPYSFMPNNQD